MAKPIKEIPILKGKGAERLIEQIKNLAQNKGSKAEVDKMRSDYTSLNQR